MKDKDRKKIKFGLLTVIANATQVYRRTIPPNKKKIYTDNLKEKINYLINKIDNNSIKNKDIRDVIKELAENVSISIGASQKVINVYLKVYCIIGNKPDSIIKELDCPIDSFVIKENKLKKISLRQLNLEDYEKMQNNLERKYGIRVLADVKSWDDKKVY